MPKRSSGLGGTDISCILGLNPFRSAFDVWLEKTGQIEPSPDDARKLWGRRLQRVIADAYAEETGRPVKWVDKTMRHPQRKFQLWTPDALCTQEPRGLDCKTAGLDQAHKWGQTGTNQVPDYVAIQMAWYMSASDRNLWDVALLVAGADFRIFTITRDVEIEGMLLESGEKFWRDHVLANKPPEITATNTTREWLKRKYPANDCTMRQATEDESNLIELYRSAREKSKEAERVADNLEMRVILAIGESDGIKYDGGSVSYRLVRESRRDYVVPAHRRLYSRFDKEGKK